ncbi:POK25 protein, partial [Ptilorrhoa leucosticta]|nr:POK25 protein [Ptilorrhoa leucosticta]
IQLRIKIHALQDLQQLLGEINWIRSTLDITNDELAPVFDLLKGDCDITSPRTHTRGSKGTRQSSRGISKETSTSLY